MRDEIANRHLRLRKSARSIRHHSFQMVIYANHHIDWPANHQRVYAKHFGSSAAFQTVISDLVTRTIDGPKKPTGSQRHEKDELQKQRSWRHGACNLRKGPRSELLYVYVTISALKDVRIAIRWSDVRASSSNGSPRCCEKCNTICCDETIACLIGNKPVSSEA